MRMISLIASLFLTLPALAKDDGPNLSKYGQLFKSYDGQVTVEMAAFADKNKDGLYDVLAKVSGQAAEKAGIDGQVIMYKAEHGGTGFNLIDKARGESFTRFTSRAGWGSWTNFQVYLDGKTFDLGIDEAGSKDVRPLHLRTAYLEASKGGAKKSEGKKK